MLQVGEQSPFDAVRFGAGSQVRNATDFKHQLIRANPAGYSTVAYSGDLGISSRPETVDFALKPLIKV